MSLIELNLYIEKSPNSFELQPWLPMQHWHLQESQQPLDFPQKLLILSLLNASLRLVSFPFLASHVLTTTFSISQWFRFMGLFLDVSRSWRWRNSPAFGQVVA